MGPAGVRTRTAAAVLALLLTLTTAACSTAGEDAGDGVIRLRFLSLAWQKESVDANKALVKEWNAAHPGVRVEYVQGSWNSVHDQLLTSFEGGEAPDVIHDASDDLADFAYGGYLADLRTLLPERLTADIPAESWRTTTFGDGVYGVPFLQEPKVLIANRKLVESSGIRLPTAERPWTWEEFREVARELTRTMGKGRYAVAWPLKEPVATTLNLGLSGGGKLFHRDADGKARIRFGDGDAVVPDVIRDQVNEDRTASRTILGSGGSDALPGFFGGKYAMVPLGFSYRQQIAQQAPDGFEWTVLPMPVGPGGAVQGVSPQTLSIAEDTRHKPEAAAFIDFMLRPANMVRLAKGDWMLPTGTAALADPALRAEKDGWSVGTALARGLRPAPAQSVRGYPEWKDKVATPAFQEYYSGAIGERELKHRLERDGNLVLARYQR
ncbi:ABC transporter substrate-binding protein [Streptomyces qinzhouensis]|uniref:Sugar ABC transporter substrate-binding protein n=1 Tax=Streptomyces qinzhouensis TaxID=2599401 RepID=A0A5B8IPU3_9ACTN|nr:sugar ABC transporter substrate-binding protein [Streptomyces qinzhouensis]QDY79609.1 sugar ABC transporter substrate-binding protein [Streptomyces qinzhouensis]